MSRILPVSIIDPAIRPSTNRRSFLRNAAGATAAVATVGLAAPKSLFAANLKAVDTPVEIFTAALIAEDLATTFYYNGLIGEVIQDVNLAGPGGTARDIKPDGNLSNVAYIRAAITEEVVHANFFRNLLGISSAAQDPYQTFYFDPAVFQTLDSFIGLLQALEQAFIGAYMAAIQQFALLAAQGPSVTLGGKTYKSSDLAYYAKIAASILGVESEHRALGRAISPSLLPANDKAFESIDGIQTVYNGPNSAVVALTPFLSQQSGTDGYSFATAVANYKNVYMQVGGIGAPAE